MLKMDELNATYVAFTRAVDELHVFAFKGKEKDSARIADFLMRFAGEWSVAPSAGLSLLPPELIRGNGNSYEIGEPPVRDAEESGGVSDHIILEDYPARPTPQDIK